MPGNRRTLTVEQLRAHLRAHAFRPAPADRVGVEVELTPLALVGERIDIRASQAAAARLVADLGGRGLAEPIAWCGGALTREPGGQVEWSGPPLPTAEDAARATARAVGRLR